MGKHIAKLLTWASIAACLFVLASFGLFALNETSSASVHQQEEVSGQPISAASAPGGPAASAHKEDSVHRAIDDVANELTSPFSSITEGASSEWVVRGVGLLCALIVYGFGLGYLARVIRVRV